MAGFTASAEALSSYSHNFLQILCVFPKKYLFSFLQLLCIFPKNTLCLSNKYSMSFLKKIPCVFLTNTLCLSYKYSSLFPSPTISGDPRNACLPFPFLTLENSLTSSRFCLDLVKKLYFFGLALEKVLSRFRKGHLQWQCVLWEEEGGKLFVGCRLHSGANVCANCRWKKVAEIRKALT